MHRFFVLLIFTLATTLASAQALTDSTIAMIAFWSPGDQLTYTFTEVEDKNSKGVTSLKSMTYDLHMAIVDSTANNYFIEWTYDNYQMDYELQAYEKELMEIMERVPIRYRTNAFGRFETIENWELMKSKAENAFTSWLEQKENIPDSLGLALKKMTGALFESEAQMKYWARDIRFFHYLYGANLYRNKPMKGTKYYTNPYIKKNMPGTETVEVLSVDEDNWVAEIMVNSGIEGEASRALMYDFILNNMESFGITDKSEVKKKDIPGFTVRESLHCIYHIPTGVIIKGQYSKRTELDKDYKKTTYTYELTE
jgi:hypothetical protein